MKKSLLKILYLNISVIITLACSNDNITKEDVDTLNCFDGILNGDEITVDCGGACPGSCSLGSIGILEGELVNRLQLDPAIEYRLTGPYLVRDQAELSIPAGTVIKADPGAGAYIAVAQGGKLFTFGQPENPVVITSGAENPAAGDWGGIIICGKAPIKSGMVDRSDIIDIFFGGFELEDTSGVINYLRIEYAGAIVDEQKKFDAIAFYGVGSFTTVTRLQTFESLGNGIRFIGGNVDAKWLLATNSNENGIVVTDDWSGNGDAWYLTGIAKVGINITSNEDIQAANPIITDTISNVSIIGPSIEGGLKYADGGGKYTFTNLYTTDMNLGIHVDGVNASSQIDIGNLNIDSIQFENPTSEFIPTNYMGTNTSFYVEGNSIGAGNGALKPEWANSWSIGLQ